MFFYSFSPVFPLIDGMKGKTLLISSWLATLAFCLLQIVAGPNGFGVTEQLRSDLTQLDENLVALEAENHRLQAKFDALRTSPTEVILKARVLGWYRPGDVPVQVLEGRPFTLPEPPVPRPPVPGPLPAVSDVFFRAAWFLFFVAFWGIFTVSDLLMRRPELTRALALGNPFRRSSPVGVE